MGKIGKARSKRGGAKRRRTVLFQDGLGALSVAAFLFLGATVREVNLLMALGAFFAGFAVLDYWQGRRSLRKLRVARKLPDAIFADEPFDVELEIDASRRRSSAWGVVVEDEWTALQGKGLGGIGGIREIEDAREISEESGADVKEDRKKRGNKKSKRKGGKSQKGEKSETAQDGAFLNVAATTRPTAYFPRVKGGERRRERYSGVVARRGVQRLATLTTSTRFPCGFFRSSERFDAPAEILVFPKIGVLTERWDALGGVARRETTQATARTSRIPGETLTVRDWRPDDSKRAIHWRATAKRDKLQARDFEKKENSVKVLILDLFFDENRRADLNASLQLGENSEFGKDCEEKSDNWNGGVAENRRDRGKKRGTNRAETLEAARRAATVEKAVSFAATLIERWTRSSDAKFLLALNGEESAIENAAVQRKRRGLGKKGGPRGLERMDDWGEMGDWGGRVESGSGAFRRALARLATVAAPRRDRLAAICASLDPRVLANAQIFIVSVGAFDEARLAENDCLSANAASTGGASANAAESVGRAVASAAERGVDGRWGDACLIDASAIDFNDYFEF